jgi:hypothetical protein
LDRKKELEEVGNSSRLGPIQVYFVALALVRKVTSPPAQIAPELVISGLEGLGMMLTATKAGGDAQPYRETTSS